LIFGFGVIDVEMSGVFCKC